MAVRTIRLEYEDVVKVFLVRHGTEPRTFDELLSLIAAKIPSIGLELSTKVLRLHYLELQTFRKIALEDDDDLITMFHDYPVDERLNILASLEDVNPSNRRLLLNPTRLDNFLGRYLGRASDMNKPWEPVANPPYTASQGYSAELASVSTGSKTVVNDLTSTPYAHPAIAAAVKLKPSQSSLDGSSGFDQSPPRVPKPRTFLTFAPVPSDLEWNLLIDSKRVGHWTDVTLDISKDQIQRVMDGWELIKSKLGLANAFSTEVLHALLEQNPSLIVMEGVTYEAVIMQRSREDQRDAVGELIWLGARHARWWKVGHEDFRVMIVAILHALSNHHAWVPGGSKDLLAWRTVLCEMIGVMSRGLVAGSTEIQEAKSRIDAMKAKAAVKGQPEVKEKRLVDRCKVM
ncbi:hypothetical protein HDU93_007062 [Gonapodya sp. JEL0774]|nr:hypothetical protein HDU93_007062 [Gonapodya sp. JEL0774]